MALKKISAITTEKLYHEHVTNYIYTHPESFRIGWIEGPECLQNHPNIRLTIDTKEDFDNAAKIYGDLCMTNPYPKISEIINYLDNHVTYYDDMKNQIEKNNNKYERYLYYWRNRPKITNGSVDIAKLIVELIARPVKGKTNF